MTPDVAGGKVGKLVRRFAVYGLGPNVRDIVFSTNVSDGIAGGRPTDGEVPQVFVRLLCLSTGEKGQETGRNTSVRSNYVYQIALRLFIPVRECDPAPIS